MEDLIKALQILSKYGNPDRPFDCQYNTLYICIDSENVSNEDIIELDELGIFINEEDGQFMSFKYGRA